MTYLKQRIYPENFFWNPTKNPYRKVFISSQTPMIELLIDQFFQNLGTAGMLLLVIAGLWSLITLMLPLVLFYRLVFWFKVIQNEDFYETMAYLAKKVKAEETTDSEKSMSSVTKI